METRTNQYPPAQILDTLAELNNTAARHVTGQLAMTNPRSAHAMAIFCQLDQRGQDAMINCGVFHLRYKQEG